MGSDSVRRAFMRPLWSPVMALAIAGLPLALPTQQAAAQVAPTPEQEGLPFYDIRLDAKENASPSAQRAIDVARAASGKEREAEIQALKNHLPMFSVDADPRYGTPQYVRSTAAFLTEPSKLSGPEVTAQFIADHPALLEVPASEIAKARVSRDYLTDHNGVRHLTFTQQINGIDLFECEVRSNVMPDGRLINIGSTMLPRPAGDFAVRAPTLPDTQAIDAAARYAGVTLTTPCTPREEAQGAGQKRAWVNSPDLRADEPVLTELAYFAATRTDIRTAWKVTIPVKGVGHTYTVLVDANSGELLWRQDWLCFAITQPITFRVFTSDSPAPGSPGTQTPTGVQFPFVAPNLVTVTPQMMQTYSPNGWINDGGMETIGNNVDAHLDRDGTANSPDLPRPNGGASRVFDFTYDVNQAPTANATQQSAAVSQLFYWSNWYHDQLYALGFNEAAGNFQTLNLISGQGVGNDAIQADAQDGSGTNNANFGTTGTDGSTGRCQMYIFTAQTAVDRDGDLDGDVVIHELTHGTSIRIHHGLSGNQAGSMGEGWGDYMGLSMLSEPADDPDAAYAMGGYATYLFFSTTYTTNYYYGIRRYPYCTDMNKNPLVYHHIVTSDQPAGVPRNTGVANTASEVHNAGEVWCMTLLECRANLMHQYGFAGNQRMMQLAIDGMKLTTTSSPTFITSRDAILQADMVNNASADRSRLWQAFAKRGLGVSAASPGVDGFDTPQFVAFSFPNGTPTQLAPNTPTAVRATMTPNDLTITPNTQLLHYSINGGSDTTTPMSLVSGNTYQGVIPAQGCGTRVAYYVETGTSIGNRTSPSDAPTTRYPASVYTADVAGQTESFETGTAGWTQTLTRYPGTGTAAMTGAWERTTAPVSTAAAPGTAHTGSALWVTQNGLAGGAVGTADVDNAIATLTSANLDLSAGVDATISYWFWYTNNNTTAIDDTWTVEVSTNGGTNWTNAQTLSGSQSPGWRQASWTLSSLGLSPTSQVRVRFNASDNTSGSIVEAAVDDFKVDIRTCTAGGTCGPQDFNGDGDAGTDQDIEAFFACLGGNCCATCWPAGADFNGDGDIGTDQDIEAFFRVLGGGTC